MTAHANCPHEVTSQARAACRKERLAVAQAHAARRANVIRQLDVRLGSSNLLERVCCRYQGAVRRAQDLHRDHTSHDDCADSILRAIDFWRADGQINVPENDLFRHACRMFS